MSRGFQKIVLGTQAGEQYWVQTFYDDITEDFQTSDIHVADDGSVVASGKDFTTLPTIVLFDKDGEYVTNADQPKSGSSNNNRLPLYHTGVSGNVLNGTTYGASDYGYGYSYVQVDDTVLDSRFRDRGGSPTASDQATILAVNALSDNTTLLLGGRMGDEGGELIARTVSSTEWNTGYAYTGPTNAGWVGDIVVDSSDNVYAFGTLGSANAFVYKVNSSGVTQFCSTIALVGVATGATIYTNSVRGNIDSSGNMYWVGTDADDKAIWVKFNSSGTVNTLKRTNFSGGVNNFNGAHADNNGITYFTNNEYIQSDTYASFARITTSGNITLPTRFAIHEDGQSPTSGATQIRQVIEHNKSVYLVGVAKTVAANNYRGFVAKIPNDGSLTGGFSNGSFNVDIASASIGITDRTSDWSSGGGSLDSTDYTTSTAGVFSTGYTAANYSTTPKLTYPTKVDIE